MNEGWFNFSFPDFSFAFLSILLEGAPLFAVGDNRLGVDRSVSAGALDDAAVAEERVRGGGGEWIVGVRFPDVRVWGGAGDSSVDGEGTAGIQRGRLHAFGSDL